MDEKVETGIYRMDTLIHQENKADRGKARVDLLPKSAESYVSNLPWFKLYLQSHNDKEGICLADLGESLLKCTSLFEVGEVIAFGVEKYSEESWKTIEVKRYWAALGRHLHSIDMGDVEDVESGLTHYAHAMTNVLFILDLETWEVE